MPWLFLIYDAFLSDECIHMRVISFQRFHFYMSYLHYLCGSFPRITWTSLHIINIFKFIVHFRMPWLFYDAFLSDECIHMRIISFKVFTFFHFFMSYLHYLRWGGGGGGTIKLLAATLKPLELGFLSFVPFRFNLLDTL